MFFRVSVCGSVLGKYFHMITKSRVVGGSAQLCMAMKQRPSHGHAILLPSHTKLAYQALSAPFPQPLTLIFSVSKAWACHIVALPCHACATTNTTVAPSQTKQPLILPQPLRAHAQLWHVASLAPQAWCTCYTASMEQPHAWTKQPHLPSSPSCTHNTPTLCFVHCLPQQTQLSQTQIFPQSTISFGHLLDNKNHQHSLNSFTTQLCLSNSIIVF